jgi:PAS domain S-box-containing protein
MALVRMRPPRSLSHLLDAPRRKKNANTAEAGTPMAVTGLTVSNPRADHTPLLIGEAAANDEPVVQAVSYFSAAIPNPPQGPADRLRAAVDELQHAQEALRESEDRLNAIVQSAMDAIIAVDARQRVVIFNGAAQKMFGYSAAEALGMSISHFIPERFRAEHAKHVRQFGETGATSRTMGGLGMVWGRRANGEEFPIEASISHVESNGNKLFTVILRDITERERAQLHAMRLAAIVESCDDAILGTDLAATIITWNQAAERLYGYSASEALGQSTSIITPNDRLEESNRLLRTIVEGGRVQHHETVRRRKDGSQVHVSLNVSPIKDGQGRTVGVSKIAHDITERKRAEAVLREQAEELARSNRDLEQFAYVASHDLQEPLRMVAAYTQLLTERYQGKLDETADKYIAYARNGALRMQTLIQDLLAFARAGRNGAGAAAVDCNMAVKNALLNLKPAIQESGAVVTCTELPTVWAACLPLTQVFQNLIGNAIKFRKKNETPQVSLQAERNGQSWLFTVADNGIGIAPDNAQGIFAVFQRLHARSEYPGNGIGLAICRKVVEHYGGKIWVESQPGQGSKFKFTLPVQNADGKKQVES